jgi:hypothetical protein
MAETKQQRKARKAPERRPSVFSDQFVSALNRIGKELEPLTESERRAVVSMLHEQFCSDGES